VILIYKTLIKPDKQAKSQNIDCSKQAYDKILESLVSWEKFREDWRGLRLLGN
jgi:hypothetical protein